MSAADYGHSVILYEKTDKLGGQALLFDVLWFKQEMKLFHERMERQVRKHPHIHLLINTTATCELIEASDADAVIAAVGAEQFVPPISGVEKPSVQAHNQFIDGAFDVINVCNCKRASDIAHAVESGYDAGAIL